MPEKGIRFVKDSQNDNYSIYVDGILIKRTQKLGGLIVELKAYIKNQELRTLDECISLAEKNLPDYVWKNVEIGPYKWTFEWYNRRVRQITPSSDIILGIEECGKWHTWLHNTLKKAGL